MKVRNSNSLMYPIDGKNSAAENILQNEISSTIEFVERAPTFDSNKGIYLIGGSLGSWISLLTVKAFPDKIKGVVFLSPGIIPAMVTTFPGKFDRESYFKSLTDSFGDRPALAIGEKYHVYKHHRGAGSAAD
jgi:pimeloyl-ACP methyl ester carboxylesterase